MDLVSERCSRKMRRSSRVLASSFAIPSRCAPTWVCGVRFSVWGEVRVQEVRVQARVQEVWVECLG